MFTSLLFQVWDSCEDQVRSLICQRRIPQISKHIINALFVCWWWLGIDQDLSFKCGFIFWVKFHFFGSVVDMHEAMSSIPNKRKANKGRYFWNAFVFADRNKHLTECKLFISHIFYLRGVILKYKLCYFKAYVWKEGYMLSFMSSQKWLLSIGQNSADMRKPIVNYIYLGCVEFCCIKIHLLIKSSQSGQGVS